MANAKMTKKDWFAVLRGMVKESGSEQTEDLLAFIDHEVELLSKKSTKSGNSKKEQEQGAVMGEILDALKEFGKAVTVTELMTVLPYSNQKISAMLKKMVEDFGTVTKTVEKKKAYFAVAVAEVEETEETETEVEGE